jgi:uncharacterized membrane protein YfcA
MHDFWTYIVTFFASLLTLITGFGLGTILTPVFALFYDIKLAILLVAIVHFLNNALKLLLFRRYVDVGIIKRFGILSIIGAVLGAWLQLYVDSTELKVVLGVLLIILGTAEFLPKSVHFRLPQSIDVVGGFLSGLLGGLVGNQGAIRSAYLLNYIIPKESFIATATVIAIFVDATRIPLYITMHKEFLDLFSWNLLIVILIAFLGTMVGKRFLQSFSTEAFKKVVAGAVLAMGLCFVLGVL